jgi:hypothetical protein
MTDEQIASLITAAEDRASILYLSVTRDAYEDGNLMDKLVECIDAQAAEITRLREALEAIEALGSDGEHSGDRHARCRDTARATLAQETQP